MNRRTIFRYIIVACVFSCRSSMNDEKFDPAPYVKDQVLPSKFSPEDYHGKPIEVDGIKYSGRPDSISNWISGLLHLDTLTAGYKNLQIRIWYGSFGDSIEKMLLLK